jgi:hypothetical protein
MLNRALAAVFNQWKSKWADEKGYRGKLAVVAARMRNRNLAGAWGQWQGRTLVHFSSQPKPFWSHLPVSPFLLDWGKIMRPTYPTK